MNASTYCVRSAVVLLLATMVASVSRAAPAPRFARSDIMVNLREAASAPTADNRITGVLRSGQIVEILDYEGEYALVLKDNGRHGFLRAIYLNLLPPDERVVIMPGSVQPLDESCDCACSKAEQQAARVAEATLMVNLREQPQPPTPHNTITAVLKPGQKVAVLRSKGEYRLVENDAGKRGYVRERYLRWQPRPAAAPIEGVEGSVVAVAPLESKALAEPPVDEPLRAPDPVSGPSVARVPVTGTRQVEADSAEGHEITAARAGPARPPAIEVTRLGRTASCCRVTLLGGANFTAASKSGVQAALQQVAPSATVASMDDSAPSLGLAARWQLQRWLGVELSVVNMGQYALDFTVNQSELDAMLATLADQHPVGGLSAGLNLMFEYGVHGWRFGLGGGYLQALDGTIKTSVNGQTITLDTEDQGFSAVAALDVALGGRWFGGLRFDHVHLNQDLNSAYLTVSFAP